MKVVVAENLLLKPQLLSLTRSRKRAPNLSSFDRFFLWPVVHLFESSPHQAGGRSRSTVYASEIASGLGETEISVVVFVPETKEARPERPFPRTHYVGAGDETAQSPLWLPKDCRADFQDLCPPSR